MNGFRTILLDPPWNETGGGKIKRGADRHYPLVKTRDLPSVIKGSGVFLPADDAHLWCWATNNKLPDALLLGAELGFEYKTNAVWCKTSDPSIPLQEFVRAYEKAATHNAGMVAREAFEKACAMQIGLGQYLRGAHEHLLFFTRGKGQDAEVWNGHRDVRSVIRARRTTHSTKPVEAYEMIERVSKGDRLEMFARSGRGGWLSWGNEVNGTATGDEAP